MASYARGPGPVQRTCGHASVRRLIHFSAVGVDRAMPSTFSASKRAGKQAPMATDPDRIILRPSVVVGRGAYGASALFRGLACLPIVPTMPDTGKSKPSRRRGSDTAFSALRRRIVVE